MNRLRTNRTRKVSISQTVSFEAVITVDMATVRDMWHCRRVLTKYTLFKVDVFDRIGVLSECLSEPVTESKDVEVRQNVKNKLGETMPKNFSVHVLIAELPQ